MKVVLLTSDNCEPCKDLKSHFADLIANGEIEEKNLERDPAETLRLMNKFGANLPSLLILSNAEELVLMT